MNEYRYQQPILKAAIRLAGSRIKPARSLAEALFSAEAGQYAVELGQEFCLGIDLWEGNGDVNEQAFQVGGVKLLLIRLNSITGGHHLDENFATQWAQAYKLFLRVPYFVYNPWAGGLANYQWLAANLPAGVRRVAIDIEVKRDGYSPAIYAAEVAAFIKLCKAAGLWIVIYTGGWFLPILSKWPTDVDYWWARYPYSMYPAANQNITWERLYELIKELSWAPGPTPGPCLLWQCSGDSFKLPGSNNRVIDVNIWRGSLAELAAWVGEEAPKPVRWEYAMTAWARPLGYTGPDPDRLGT